MIWMMVIFHLSSQQANQSNNLSTGLTLKVVEVIEKVTGQTNLNIEDFNHIIRKCAHFSIYLVLALLVLNALINSNKAIRSKVILTMIICILYAASDEFHQIFVSGRGPQVKDIFIDSCGALVGTGIYLVVWKNFKKRTVQRLS